MTPSFVRVRRPTHHAQVHAYMDELSHALDLLDIPLGSEFVVARAPAEQPSLLEPPAPDFSMVGPSRNDGPDTSRQAALHNYPRSGTQRWKVIQAVFDAGQRGRTRDQLAEELGLPPNVIGPRVLEAMEGGWIKVTEMERKTRSGSPAEVLVITDDGIAEVRLREGREFDGIAA